MHVGICVQVTLQHLSTQTLSNVIWSPVKQPASLDDIHAVLLHKPPSSFCYDMFFYVLSQLIVSNLRPTYHVMTGA